MGTKKVQKIHHPSTLSTKKKNWAPWVHTGHLVGCQDYRCLLLFFAIFGLGLVAGTRTVGHPARRCLSLGTRLLVTFG